jgi:hypothetical protein
MPGTDQKFEVGEAFKAMKDGLEYTYTEPEVEDIPERLAHEKPVKPKVEGGTLLKSREIPDQKIQDIATKYGMNVQQLRDLTDLYGGLREYTGGEIDSDNALTSKTFWKSVALDAAGAAESGAGLGIPSWIYKKMQTEQGQKAFDEIRTLAHESRSYARAGLEMLAPSAGTKYLAAKLGRAAPAAIGAIAGMTGSKSGEELSGLASGAVTASVLQQGLPAVWTNAPVVFKKIVNKFDRPDTVVNDLSAFKAVRDKFEARPGQLMELIESSGVSVKPGVESASQLVKDYGRILLELKWRIRKDLEKNPEYSKLRPSEKDLADNKAVLDLVSTNPEDALVIAYNKSRDKLKEVADVLPLEDTFNLRQKYLDAYDAKGGLYRRKADRVLNQVFGSKDTLLKSLAKSTINEKLFRGDSSIQGFSVGDKATFSVGKIPEGELDSTALHEFTHRMVGEAASSIGDSASLAANMGKIYSKINSHIPEDVMSDLSSFLIKKNKYREEAMGSEAAAWITTLLNSKTHRDKYGAYLNSVYGDKGDSILRDQMSKMKVAQKDIRKWANNVTAEDLKKQINETDLKDIEVSKPIAAMLDSMPYVPAETKEKIKEKSVELLEDKSYWKNFTNKPGAKYTGDWLVTEDMIKHIPGSGVDTVKLKGETFFKAKIFDLDFGTFHSANGARTRILEYWNKLIKSGMPD